MLSLLATLLLPSATARAIPLPGDSSRVPTAIRITLVNGARYGSGDRVRVQVQTGDDGYLVVLRVDTDGHVRVLFPIDPDIDAFVRGGKSYELRGRADRQTFLADEHNGDGVIYAAIAHEPMRFRDFSVGDHWDYDALRLRDSADDVEAELSRIVARMTDNGHFDYDIVDYSVTGPYIAAVGGAYPTTYGSYYGGGFDPYYDCLGCRWGYRSINFGFSYGNRCSLYYSSWYYDPFYCDSYYGSPYSYGYYSYPGSYWRYPGQGLPITVINLPRPQIPTTPYGFRSRPRPTIPVVGGNLTNLGRSGALGGGSTPSRRTGSPGTYSGGDRSRDANTGERSRGQNSAPRSSTTPTERTSPPPRVDRQPPSSSGSSGTSSGAGTSSSAGTRSRPRGGGSLQDAPVEPPTQRATPVSIDRRVEDPRPVYREPPRAQPVPTTSRDVPRQDAPRPVYREPPRVERTPTYSAPAVRSSPPPAPSPVVRSSPPPSSPPASSGGSGSTTSSPPRSRPGGGGR